MAFIRINLPRLAAVDLNVQPYAIVDTDWVIVDKKNIFIPIMMHLHDTNFMLKTGN